MINTLIDIFTLLLLSVPILLLALVFGYIISGTGRNFIMRLFIIIVVLFLIPAITECSMEDSNSRRTELLQTSISIYSMKPTNSITGNFILGFGSINNTEYYIFLVKNNGGFIRRKVPINETLVIEKDTHPSIITNSIVRISYFNRLNGRQEKRDTLDYNSKSRNDQPIKNDLGYKYIITIPKGSITENQIYQVL